MSLNKYKILAQKPVSEPRSLWHQWPVVVAILPFFGVVAAFGIAPDTVPEPVELQHVVEEIALPVSPHASTEEARYWREERIQRGDTVASVLARLNVNDADALTYLLQAKDVRSLYQLIPGRTIRVVTTDDGQLESLSYLNTDGRLLHVTRDESGFSSSEELPQTEQWVMQSSGEIETSLFAATDSSGIPEFVALQLAEIFSSDIDFHRDLRRGDRFSVVYEALAADGEFVGFGRVSVSGIRQSGAQRSVRYFFRDDQGRNGYYTPDGRNMRKAFLRSPIEFSRVTSGFTSSRFHPVLKTWRAHKGIDYGAPYGHTGTRHFRRLCHIRRSQGRLWQRRDRAPPQWLCNVVCAPVRIQPGPATGKARGPGRNRWIRWQHRTGHRSAFALRIPRQRRASESDATCHASWAADHCPVAARF